MNPFTRDERYGFQGFDQDFLIGLGRLVIGSSHLESSASVLLARLIHNDGDLKLGQRLTANATFPWLIDHIRAVSELKQSKEDHAAVVAWLERARLAYAARSRIIHAGWGVDIGGDAISFVFTQSTARKKTFVEENWPATAKEVHEIAVELERVGLDAIDLMLRIPRTATSD